MRAQEMIQDNQAMELMTIHTLLHEGKLEKAQRWADRMGLNLPPGEKPKRGFPLEEEVCVFLRQTFESHRPTESGLPDHEA